MGGDFAVRKPEGLFRFVWLALVVALPAFLATGFWFYRLQQQALRMEVEKNLAAIARTKAEQIIAWRKDQLADADLRAHPFLLESATRFLTTPAENNRRSLEELKTLTTKDVTPEGAEDRLSAIAKGDRNLGEVVYLRPDGSRRVALLSAVPLDEGQAFGIAVDITDRKQAEEERARLTSAVEQAAEMFVITDIDGNIRYVNPAFEKITGYTLTEVLGQSPRILKNGEHDDAFYAHLWRTILSGGTWQGQMTNKRKDGALFVEKATISPVLNRAGRHAGT